MTGKPMNRILASSIIAATLFSSITMASDIVEPTVRIQIEPRKIDGRQIDVLGIVPGMTAAEVENILTAHDVKGRIDTRKGTVGGNIRGVNVRTAEFTQSMSVETRFDANSPIHETIIGSYSTPASGNRLMRFSRQVSYRNALEAPEYSTILDSVLAKYGTPSVRKERREGFVGDDLTYHYKAGRQINCERTSPQRCPIDVGTYDVGLSEDFRRGAEIVDLVITIKLSRNGGGRITGMTIEVVDWGLQAQASSADIDALMQHVSNRLATTKPSNAPRL
jgi:hypothetical protein